MQQQQHTCNTHTRNMHANTEREAHTDTEARMHKHTCTHMYAHSVHV